MGQGIQDAVEEVVDAVEDEMERETKDPPLYLPVGSVRALLAIFVTATTSFMVAKQLPIPEWWLLAFSGIVAAYFNSRKRN